MSPIARRTIALFAGTAVLLPAVDALAISADRELAECSVAVWRAQDGLPGGWIRALTQSADGYLWIGTQGGLARYGGGALLPVLPEHPFERAADIMGLSVARDGALWLTPGRGPPVCVRGDAFAECASGPLPPAVRIADLSQDDAGGVWLAAPEGIFHFAGQRFTLAIAAADLGSSPPTAVHRDRRGDLWVGTAAGLFVRRAGNPAVVRQEDVAVAALFETARGQLWVAADKRLLHIDGARTEAFTERDGLPAARFTTIIEDRGGNVWIGSREGLIRFRPGRGFAVLNRADGLPDPDVSALFEDREGSLWVGTRAGGVAQFTDRTLDRKASPPSLLNQWVGTVAEDAEGTLWAGSTHGLTRFRGGQERTFTSADGLPGDQVLSVLPAPGGVLWVGTDRGLCRFQPGQVQPVAEIGSPVTALMLEADGALWIGANSGLHRLHQGRLQRFSLDPAALAGLSFGEMRSIARDDQGVVWISANGNLLRLDGDTLRRDRDPAGATIGKVRSIARDADGTLWLGSGDGLIRRRHGRWRIFGAREGLGRGDLFQVAPDDEGFLWIGASHGLLRIARSSLEEVDRGRRPSVDVVSFEIWDQQREVRATRTRQPGVWKSGGRLRFATSRGVVSVDPRRLPVNPLPPPVFVERAFVDGRPARREVVNHFPPGSGAFEFQFAAITLIEPRKAQHRYLLEGFDRGWVEAGTRRSAYYTNMKPGRYRFRVQGSNADGVWNETGDALELTLAPHFHQTTWFFALIGLGAASLVLSFHRLRLERLRGRYVATAAERARVAREVHDSLLQGMTAALMHLRGLRKRFGPSAPAVSTQTIAGEIKAIEEVVASNIEETRHFIWDLREGKPAVLDLPPALGELLERAVAGTAIDGAMVVEGEPVPVSRHLHRELLRISHEALTNAVKHSGARHIELRLGYQEGSITLAVSDDGAGFDPQSAAGSQTGHFGLVGMSERGALLGRFGLESQPGQGTTVEVTVNLKDLRDA